jgi:hypothetical protein
MATRSGGLGTALFLAVLAGLLGVQVAWIPATNFGGFDEWVMLDLSSRGIMDVAYANRPFGLLWLLPGPLIAPHSFAPFGLLFFVYLVSASFLLRRLCLGLVPGRPAFALLSAAFFLVWAPGDLARLSTVERALYGGITFGAVAAVALFVESWVRRSAVLLWGSALLALVLLRSYEGGLAVLAAAPLLLLATQPNRVRPWRWVAVWEVVVLVAAALVLARLAGPGEAAAYQRTVLHLERDPGAWAVRLLWQFVYHLFPLATSSPRELLAPAALLTVAILNVGLVPALSGADPPPGRPRLLLRAALLGLLFAGLGYSLILLGAGAPSAFRLQFLSGPGIAVFLAAVVCSAPARLPRPWGLVATSVLASWVAAVGAGRTIAMQATWDAGSAYPAQVAMLRGLVKSAPDLRPETLVLLLDDGKAWKATFGFHHALRYLYEGRAAGCVWGAWNALYPAVLGADGLRVEPWPVIRGPWREKARTYPYDHMIVARFTAPDHVEILRAWPEGLPPLPRDARYDPEARILRGAVPPPEQDVLREGRLERRTPDR